MELSINDRRRVSQHKRANLLVRKLRHKGYRSRCIIQEEPNNEKVYFADCVKIILTCRGEGFVVRVKSKKYQVIPNHQFFESLDETERLELIETNFTGLLAIIRETTNGRKYGQHIERNKRVVSH